MIEDEPRLYDAKFLPAWERFTDRVKQAFEASDTAFTEEVSKYGDVSLPSTDLQALQLRYVLANMALADLFRDLDQREISERFHAIAEALHDVVNGLPHSLFRPTKIDPKAGRQRDSSDRWRIRASVAVGIEYLIASGMEPGAIADKIYKNHRTALAKLQRTNTDLKKSLIGWTKAFANLEVSNDVALDTYREGMQHLHMHRSVATSSVLAEQGWKFISSAANRASRLPESN